MESEYLLKADQLSHSFDYKLFEDISLAIREGESIAIVGKSGSGKSTLLHNLSGFLKPLKGSVIVEGRDLYSLPSVELDRVIRYDIGIIFQMHYLFKGMSAKANIEISAMMTNQSIDDDILEHLDIKNVLNQRASTLSGGQQQRVSIARVLAKRPKLIFADEPTGNLDIENANIVMDTLLSYTKRYRASLFLVTHDQEMAKKCDRVYSLKDGNIIEINYQI